MIRSLNLDSMFVPTQHAEIEFTMLKFSGGELHIKLNNNIEYSNIERVVITNRFNNSDDLMEMLIAKDALARKGVKCFDLVIPYIPYARQDRVCDHGEAFSLKVFANLINDAKFDNVFVLDSHSDVAPALIDNCVNIPNYNYVVKSCLDINSDIILISPDSGANKKANGLFNKTKLFKQLVKCDKFRDTSNGNLTGFEVFCEDLNKTPCLIVDDICDGGRTFIGIAKALKQKNAGKIFLFVTHGIFSNEFDELGLYFDKIYTTNSIKEINNDIVKQYKIQL